MQWAQFQYYYPDDFAEAIADSEGCGTTTTEVEENNPPSPIAEECLDALDSFNDTYGLNLTTAERKEIIFSMNELTCVDQPFTFVVAKAIISLIKDNNSDFVPSKEISKFLSEENNVQILMELWFYSKTDEGKTKDGASSMNIYTSLAEGGLLDLTVDQAYSEEFDPILTKVIGIFLSEEQKQLSLGAWYNIFKRNISGDKGWMESITEAITIGWKDVIQYSKGAMKTILEELEANDIPVTDEEWQTIMAIYGPSLVALGVDIGTDFIPVVGELKGLYNTGDALIQGNFGIAALEFLGTIAGIIPIGDLAKGSTKVVAAATTLIAAFKVIKALAKASSGIFKKITSLVKNGWEVLYDDVLKKIVVKNSNDIEVASIVDDVEDLSPNIKIDKPEGKVLLLTNSIKNLDAVDVSSDAAQSLANAAKKNPANHMRFTPNSPAQQDAITDILAGDPTGKKTELLMKDHLAQDGWVHKTGGKYGSDNGYDNVFYNPNTGEVLIDESKQWGPQLSGQTPTNPKQMSDLWIQKVIDKISTTDTDLAGKIQNALDNEILLKTVSAVKKTDPGKGSIITIKVGG